MVGCENHLIFFLLKYSQIASVYVYVLFWCFAVALKFRLCRELVGISCRGFFFLYQSRRQPLTAIMAKNACKCVYVGYMRMDID